jgi:DNA helicase II / ATP-dependent DNA helicase PcrA
MPASFAPQASVPQSVPVSIVQPRVPGRRLRVGILAFNKHIADEMNLRLRAGSVLLPGSPEQEAIWEHLLHGTSHAVVQACAGTGKTWVIIQGILRLQQEYGADVTATTYNSFGWRACIHAFHPQLDDQKVGRIVEAQAEQEYGRVNMEYHDWIGTLSATRKLVALCMNCMFDGKNTADLDRLADKHNLPLNGNAARVYDLVPRVLAQCAEDTAVMCFDDQVWQTVTKGLPTDTYDLLFVDECQDTNLAQQQMVFMACPKGRVIFVGDTNQAIFGFRGADTDSMPRMQERLGASERGVDVFPLTVTRRCPTRHVRLAQGIVPDIQAMPDAPDGEVHTYSPEQALRSMAPGDLVLCRTNAPLVAYAYALIKRNVKAIVRGRDIGTGLRQLIDKLRAGDSVTKLLEKLEAYQARETEKLKKLGDKGKAKLESLNDRCECVTVLTDGVNSVTALKTKIDRIFADFDDSGKPRDAVVLGSVHRTKGLEAHTVYVLAPELLPHPMATQTWERVQEHNLAYVAVTRAKYDVAAGEPGRLVFVLSEKTVKMGVDIPAIYYGDGRTAFDRLVEERKGDRY